MKKYVFIIIGIVVVFVVLLIFKLLQPSSTSILSTKRIPSLIPKLPKSTSTPTPMPTSEPTPTQKESFPSQIIDLTNWKITLPVENPNKSNRPLEIRQPQLARYKIDPWFIVASDGTGVQFRAPVNSPTTSGSKYPRSELREMADNGTTNAAWSSTQGTHTMFLDQVITKVPKIKKHVVAGQIHDDNDDIIVIRLEYPNLYINVDGKNVYILDSSYALGKRFTIKFEVNGAQTKVYYNNSQTPVYILNLNYSSAYFKAGAYTQSNCTREIPFLFCNDDNYGEVVIYKAIVEHI